jgi:hypothetical protein
MGNFHQEHMVQLNLMDIFYSSYEEKHNKTPQFFALVVHGGSHDGLQLVVA